MELRTYTGLWQVEKRLYKFYDINLPYPVSIRQLLTFMLSTIVWFVFVGTLGVPFAPPFGHLIWIVPPIAITVMANRPIAEGKTAVQFLWAQLRFVFAARRYADGAPTHKGDVTRQVSAEYWTELGK